MKTIYTLLLMLALSCAPQAQTFTVLHTFQGYDGEGPLAQLTLDSSGNLYGTTVQGGVLDAISPCGKSGCGTSFMLNKAGKQIWQHSFDGRNGQYPFAGMLRDSAGNLFGATEQGGANCYGTGFPGCGTVYMLGKTGKETLLYSFAGAPDGFFPESVPVGDVMGNLYGTTPEGGIFGAGAVFKIDSTGKETVLYSFTGDADGCGPGQLIMDAAGNLYGATADGGAGFCNSGYGVVFELDTSGTLTVLHTFVGGDGAYPGISIRDAAGNIYGGTAGGGIGCGTGCGTLFELSPQGSGNWSETLLYEFCSLAECADGESPGPPVMDAAGNLYGITVFGGTHRNCNGDGCGTVFKLDATGNESVLHSFTGGTDGAFPSAGLAMDSAGNLYGNAEEGGDTACYPPHGCGTVFKLTP